MLKKNRFIFIFLIISISLLAINKYSDLRKPAIHSTAAVLMDASNGEILYEKDAGISYPVASMSKLMTMYIVLDLLEDEVIDWSDHVTVSENANDLIDSAAKIPVESGTILTVQDLYYAMAISSANNATIALAKYISGTEEEFTLLMNEKARELGLSEGTNFVNATGLPNAEVENQMSARDVATLAHNLLTDHPEVLEAVRLEHYYIESFGIDLYTTNRMLNKHEDEAYVKEVDGLKTGYTDAAGYCFVGTAMKGDRRLISVVINAETDEDRFSETKKLLSYGFSPFTF
ncbi:D-alanyl-D-alanine carboxypeptidase family protein [Pseudogracilibacillus auburnensis]|uniref:D-alanyl-D-alanine carboxypeptidase family protein n=1 Tax=Pseudogracilibacillus auburnensis TaxID=1494959 RepID=UPI001F623834|nr:D-alanyl-D-alanine carboxypeptidase family protein [Pseudogracilibacillus auburnensis]